MNVKKYVLVILLSFLGGCASTSFTKTGTVSLESRNDNCDFTVYSTSPQKPFVELGVVDISMICFGVCPSTNKLSKVKELIAPKVCSAGGNGALIWEANGFGYYHKVTVIDVQD